MASPGEKLVITGDGEFAEIACEYFRTTRGGEWRESGRRI